MPPAMSGGVSNFMLCNDLITLQALLGWASVSAMKSVKREFAASEKVRFDAALKRLRRLLRTGSRE